MVAFGASGATPKHRMVQISAGLGLLEGIVVDQHFEQRTRLGRLLAVVAQSPSLLGVGLDAQKPIRATVRAEQAKRQVAKLARTIAAEGADSLAMERSRRRRHEEREASE